MGIYTRVEDSIEEEGPCVLALDLRGGGIEKGEIEKGEIETWKGALRARIGDHPRSEQRIAVPCTPGGCNTDIKWEVVHLWNFRWYVI